MNPSYYQTVPRKKDKTDMLISHPYLKDFVLDCRLLNKNALRDMLNKYPMVVFKPNIGGGGNNVGFMKRQVNGHTHVLQSTNEYIFEEISDLYDFIRALSKRRFILQEGVSLLTFENRPFDIRIEVQKVYDEWVVSGICAKIAPPDKMVTNRYSGGHGIFLKQLFPIIGISEKEHAQIHDQLMTIGQMTAQFLNEKFDGLRELGLDIGIDKRYHLYIIEINTKPQFGIFRQAGDKEMFERIEENNRIILASINCIKREL